MVGYSRRLIDVFFDENFDSLPAVLLDGPKAVGKTFTASQRAKTTYDLSVAPIFELAQADNSAVVNGQKPVFIDEWQRVSGVFDAVKRAVDANYEGGSFLLAGSAQAPGTHSGAGRIVSVRMRTMTLSERGLAEPTISLADIASGRAEISGSSPLGLEDYADAIVRGGFPAMQNLSDHALQIQLEGYIQRIIDKDMVEAGLKVRRHSALLAWMRAYAAATATTTSWESVRDGATAGNIEKPSRRATEPYVNFLTQLRVLDDVEAWSPSANHLNKVGQAPKHFCSNQHWLLACWVYQSRL